jgi:uncharacterized SAM-binding protein YcdF (DUF218 family)
MYYPKSKSAILTIKTVDYSNKNLFFIVIIIILNLLSYSQQKAVTMFFASKKIISIFLMPLSLSLMIYSIGLLLLFFSRKRMATITLSIGFLFQLFICTYPYSFSLMESLESDFLPKKNMKNFSEISYIAVLGGGHTSNSNIPYHTQIGDESLKRFLQGYFLMKKYPKAKIIFSGYGGSDINSHANILAGLAERLGVEKSKIITLSEPRDTYEESLFIKDIVKNKKFILVTSASHLKRSLVFFRQNKMNPIISPGHFYFKNIGTKDWDDYAPQAKYIKMNEVIWHEKIGQIWWNLKNKLFSRFSTVH